MAISRAKVRYSLGTFTQQAWVQILADAEFAHCFDCCATQTRLKWLIAAKTIRQPD